MEAQRPASLLAHHIRGFHFGPYSLQRSQNCPCLLLFNFIERSVPPRSGQRRKALHESSPPGCDRFILLYKFLQNLGLTLRQTQGNQCRRVPELHRPSPRSSSNAASPRPFRSFGLGNSQNPAGNLPVPTRTKPARTKSRRCAPLPSSSWAFETGTSLA